MMERRKIPFLDRLFPGRALKRALLEKEVARERAIASHFERMENDSHYRELVFAVMRASGYKAAAANKHDVPFRGVSGSADAEILGGLATMRNRSRELNQDDPLASGASLTFVNNVIGRGILPQAITESDNKNRKLEAAWSLYDDNLAPAERLNGMDRQRLIYYKHIEDGEAFIKFSKNSPRARLFEEIVEAERVSTPMDRVNDSRITEGIERDGLGVPVAYWVRKYHPGDSVYTMANASDFERIPAIDIIHFKMTRRPGQTRGVPMFHAVMQDLRDIDYLIYVAQKRMQMAAVFATFIKSTEALPNMLDMTAKTYGYELDHTLNPGMIFKLMPNESIETLVPNFPSPELVPFIVMLASRAGAALGVPWQVILKDFSKSNYSSARTDLLEARQIYTYFQQKFIRDVAMVEWRRVQEDARLMGDHAIRDSDIASVRWIAPGWKWVDPVKEAAGAEIELRIGTTCLRDLCAMKGLDWDETLRQRVREKKLLKELHEEAGLVQEPDAGESEIKEEMKSLLAALISEPDDENQLPARLKLLNAPRITAHGPNGGAS